MFFGRTAFVFTAVLDDPMPFLKNEAFDDRSWVVIATRLSRFGRAEEALSLAWFAHGDVAMRARSLPRLQPGPVWERSALSFCSQSRDLSHS
jgi:hypothetical protein